MHVQGSAGDREGEKAAPRTFPEVLRKFLALLPSLKYHLEGLSRIYRSTDRFQILAQHRHLMKYLPGLMTVMMKMGGPGRDYVFAKFN